MAISKTRWLFRFVLVVILAGVGYLTAENYLRQDTEHLWDRAQQALAEGDMESAEHHLRVLVNADNNHFDGNYQLAKIYLEEARKENPSATYADVPRAMKHLRTAAALEQGARDPELQRELLRAQLQAGHLFDAVSTAGRLLRHDDTDDDALFAMAWNDVEQKRYRQAEERIRQMDRNHPQGRYRTFALKAHLYERTKDFESMRTTLDQFLTKAVNASVGQMGSLDGQERRSLLSLLAIVVREAQDLPTAQLRASDAMTVLEKLLESKREDKEHVKQIAEAAYRVTLQLRAKRQQADPSTVAANINSPATRNVARKMARIGLIAIEEGQADPIVFHQTAESLIALDQEDHALELLNRGLEKAQEMPSFDRTADAMFDLHMLAARRLAMNKRFDEASQHLDILLSSNDSRIAGYGHFISGVNKLRAEKPQEALDHFAQARRQLGDTLMIRAGTARAFHDMGRWEDAVKMLDTLHVEDEHRLDQEQKVWRDELVGTNEHIHVLQVQAYLQMGDVKAADEHLRAIRGTDFEPTGLALVYDFFKKRGEDEKAFHFLARARERFPRDAGLFDRHVKFLEEYNRGELAALVVEDYYSRSTNSDDLLKPIAYRLERKEYKEAIAYVDRLLAQRPEDIVLLQVKANIQGEQGLLSEQLETLARLEKLMPDSATPSMLKAKIFQKINQSDRALEELNRGLAIQPDHQDARLMRVELLLERNDAEAALYETTVLLKQNPQLWQAYYLRTDALVRLNRQVEALNLLEQLRTRQPNNPQVYSRLASAYMSVNNPKKAMDVIRAGYEAAGEGQEDILKAEIFVLAAQDRVQELEQIKPDLADAWFWKADAWLRVNRQDRALRALEQAIETDPRHTDARLMLAQLRFARNENEAAVAHATSVLRREPQNLSALLIRSQAQVRLGQRDAAIASLLRVIEEDPKRVQGYLTLASILMSDDDPSKADPNAALAVLKRGADALPNDLALTQAQVELLVRLDRTEDLDKIAPNNPEVHYYKAQAWRIRNELDKARRELERALLLNADHLEARLMAVEVNLALDRNEEALAHVEEAQRRHGQMWNLVQLKARALTRLQRRDEAVKLLEDVIARQPLNVAGYTTLARMHLEARQPDAALTVIRDGLARMPENVPLIQEEINILVSENRVEELEKLKPTSPQIAYFKALAWRSHNRLDQSLAELERCLNLQPNHLPARVMAAEICLARRDDVAALNHARAVERLDRNMVNAKLIQADALRRLGRRVDAIRVLEEMIRDQPRLAVPYTRLASIYEELDSYDQAITVLRDGRRENPGSVSIIQAELETLCRAGRGEEAQKLAEALAGDKPDFFTALNFAQAFIQGKEFNLARHWAELGIKLAKERQVLQARMVLGMVLQSAGSDQKDRSLLEEAASQYRAVLAEEPTDFTASNNLAWVLSEELGRPEEALDVLQSVRGDASVQRLPIVFIDTMSRVLRRLGQLEEAQSMLTEALTISPNDPDLHFQLGMVYAAQNQRQQAADELNKALELGLEGDDAESARRTLESLGVSRTPQPPDQPQEAPQPKEPAPKPDQPKSPAPQPPAPSSEESSPDAPAPKP